MIDKAVQDSDYRNQRLCDLDLFYSGNLSGQNPDNKLVITDVKNDGNGMIYWGVELLDIDEYEPLGDHSNILAKFIELENGDVEKICKFIRKFSPIGIEASRLVENGEINPFHFVEPVASYKMYAKFVRILLEISEALQHKLILDNFSDLQWIIAVCYKNTTSVNIEEIIKKDEKYSHSEPAWFDELMANSKNSDEIVLDKLEVARIIDSEDKGITSQAEWYCNLEKYSDNPYDSRDRNWNELLQSILDNWLLIYLRPSINDGCISFLPTYELAVNMIKRFRYPEFINSGNEESACAWLFDPGVSVLQAPIALSSLKQIGYWLFRELQTDQKRCSLCGAIMVAVSDGRKVRSDRKIICDNCKPRYDREKSLAWKRKKKAQEATKNGVDMGNM